MPSMTTVYTLTVTAEHGCTGSGPITVNVFSPLRIPSAFTPNGDGENDVFYIQGSPLGSRIESFAVFDRWGKEVFHRNDIASGDPAFGWNGFYNGAPAPKGAYVYQVFIRLADGTRQLFKGTVMLER
jgi:gliding motility-associated-like protein